ncbi:MAG TPA: septal ring lytic transglycosylase RlpA family protein [Dokdonella sp.]
MRRTRRSFQNAKTGTSVELVINDRGPRQAGRVLDISPAAAKALGFSGHGMAAVSVEVVGAAPHV